MKHRPAILAIIILMFLITQFIGIFVVNHYQNNNLPYGLDSSTPVDSSGFIFLLQEIILVFIIAIVILFILTKFKIEILLKIWFIFVIIFSLGITFSAILPQTKYMSIIAMAIAIPLTISKVYGRDVIIHNLTELLIYPGIAAVFVPLLNIWTMIILLILISIYDMWAVWKSGIMQKMAKYQMDNLKIFQGFFIPYISKKVRLKIKKMKKSELKKKKIAVNLAVLGGGDVVFPIITSGVMLKFWGLGPAMLTILGATLGLLGLFIYSEKKKFYPAMPFITIGILISLGISLIIF